MISCDSTAQPSVPSPDNHLVAAQVKGSTLTRTQFNAISSITSSFLRIPAHTFVYNGCTQNPLTLYWHCSAVREVNNSCFLCAEMIKVGIVNVSVNELTLFNPLQQKVSECLYTLFLSHSFAVVTGNRADHISLGGKYHISLSLP